jgi:hypothetical protein
VEILTLGGHSPHIDLDYQPAPNPFLTTMNTQNPPNMEEDARSNSVVNQHQGTFNAVICFPWPWPPATEILLTALELDYGSLRVLYEQSGRIRAELTSTSGRMESVSSCILDMLEVSAASLFVIWGNGNLEISLGVGSGPITVGSLCNASEIVERLSLPPLHVKNTRYFTPENAAKLKWRRDTLVGTHPRRGTIRGDADYIFGELQDCILQTRDLLSLIEQGRRHHIGGLSTLVRKLIVLGEPLPLLQLCGATNNLPLMMFTASNPTRLLRVPKGVPSPSHRIVFNGSAIPTPIFTNPIDLDAWLDLGAVEMENYLLSNREHLRIIGNTTGAHLDIDIHPAVAMLRRSFARGGAPAFVNYMCSVAAMVATLSEKVFGTKID